MIGTYIGSPVGGGLFATLSQPLAGGHGFTARLGHPDARPANIMLGLGVSHGPVIGMRPWPDMMTTLTPALHTTLSTMFAHSSSLTEFDRSTTATLDE